MSRRFGLSVFIAVMTQAATAASGALPENVFINPAAGTCRADCIEIHEREGYDLILTKNARGQLISSESARKSKEERKTSDALAAGPAMLAGKDSSTCQSDKTNCVEILDRGTYDLVIEYDQWGHIQKSYPVPKNKDEPRPPTKPN